jgi:hypothetical protein
MVTFKNSHGHTIKGKTLPSAVRSTYGRTATLRGMTQVGRAVEAKVVKGGKVIDRIYVG